MLSVGVDIVEIERIAKALERFGDRFLERIYTQAEVDHCRGRVAELAARFAAKEAISKALGTGIYGLTWQEMEILPDPLGQPQVYLHGSALERARTLGLTDLAVSLSHSQEYAIAFVVAS
ncbi:MAG: holo-ACP synthase [Anaerolineae bacterium]